MKVFFVVLQIDFGFVQEFTRFFVVTGLAAETSEENRQRQNLQQTPVLVSSLQIGALLSMVV